MNYYQKCKSVTLAVTQVFVFSRASSPDRASLVLPAVAYVAVLCLYERDPCVRSPLCFTARETEPCRGLGGATCREFGGSPREKRYQTSGSLYPLRSCAKPRDCSSPLPDLGPFSSLSRAVLVRLEGCSHPVVMKGLCAECGQDLTQ